jgi:hypothetical protein
VTELPSDGPSIHEILQRLEGDRLAESGMGAISTKKELSPPSSWPESQDSNIFDAAFPRTLDDSTRDATTNVETFISPSSTQVTTPTPTLPPVNAPVRTFDSTGTVFSTTDLPMAGFSRPSPQSEESPTCTDHPFGDVYLPPWSFYRQQIDDFTPRDSTGFGSLHLP